MLFGTKKEKKPIFLALDVGTEVVKALICTVENEQVEIIGVGKVRQGYAAMKGGVVANLRSVIESCHKALDLAAKQSFKPSNCVLGIAGELVKGVLIELSYERANPEAPIEKKEIEDAVEVGYKDAREECSKIYAPYLEKSLDVVLVGAVVLGANIDGYKVDDPNGMQGANISLKIYYTFAPRLHVGYLNSVAKGLNVNVSAIVPEPFAIVRAMKQKEAGTFQGIVIDVGGGTTDIAIVKHGILYGTEMIAFGGRVFTKRIAQDLMTNYEDAESIKIKYSEKKLDKARMPEVKEAIKKDVPVWIDAVELALSQHQETVGVFPDAIYLCGGGSLLPEVKEVLIEYPWTKRLAFNRSPKVHFISADMLDKVVDKTLSLTRPEDITPMSLARIGLDL